MCKDEHPSHERQAEREWRRAAKMWSGSEAEMQRIMDRFQTSPDAGKYKARINYSAALGKHIFTLEWRG